MKLTDAPPSTQIDQQFGQSPNMLLGDVFQALNGVPASRTWSTRLLLRARTITTERNGWLDSAMQAILAYAALISALVGKRVLRAVIAKSAAQRLRFARYESHPPVNPA